MISINITNLSKKYLVGFKKNIVLKDINICITSEKCNFLLGYNGSGKSTLLKCILNHVDYEGKIEKNSKKVSYSPEKVIFPDFITPYTFLNQYLKIKKMNNETGVNSLNYYVELFNLKPHLYKNIYQLSKGNKQKINLILSLIIESDIYIFDEPLSGLDIETKEVFINEIKKLRKMKKLIIISTHNLKDFNYKVKNLIYVNKKE